jgi:hypothetical protein
MKKIISLILALSLVGATLPTVMASETSTEAIDVLTSLNIITGYEDGSIKPEQEITRAEATTMIVNALNMSEDANNAETDTVFADVNEKASWAKGFVNVGVSQGFIVGRNSNEFDPLANVTYAELCVMLTKITDYADYAKSSAKDGDAWYKCYTDMAASAGLNKGVNVPLTAALTRGQVAQMIYNALITPKLGIVEYSFVDNKYAPLDGVNSAEFKTILSEKFNGYVVNAEVIGTSKMTNNNGEATIKITKAASWRENKIETKDTPVPETVKVANIAGVEDCLFQSGTAVLLINDLDEVEMVYFSLNSKVETKEMPAEDYVWQSDRVNNSYDDGFGIKFGNSSPVKIAAGAELYLNGVAYPNAINNTVLDTYLGYAIGNVTFVKTDKNANVYDKIFVNHYEIGRVTSVTYKGEKTTVRLVPAFGGSLTIEIDDEAVLENDVEITVEKNSSEIELKDLTKNDIVAIATDFSNISNNTISNPKFISIIATDEMIRGMVTAYDDDYRTYTINGKDYKYVGYTGSDLTIATTYDLMLDPFGRIFDEGEAVSTNAKFAIVERYDASAEKVTLLLADGTIATYPIHGSSTIAADAIASFIKTNGVMNPVEDRVVLYTVSNDMVKLSNNFTKTDVTSDTFNKNTGKLGGVQITEDLNIINAQDYLSANSASISNYETYDKSNFKSNVEYDGYAFKTGDVYSFLVITNVGTVFTEDSRFAVIIKDATTKLYGDETCYGTEALYNGEEVILYWDAAPTYGEGDVIYFTTDAEGFVKADTVVKVYDKDTETFSAPTAFANLLANNPNAYDNTDWNFGFNKTIADVQLVNGYITEAKNNAITFGVVNNNIIDGNIYEDATGTVGMYTFGIDYDCQTYVFDGAANTVTTSKKYAITDASAIIESNLFEIDDTDTYDATQSILNNAVAMVVNGDIVCIFVNYPV